MCTVSRRRPIGSSTTTKNTALIRTTPAKCSCEDEQLNASCASTTWGFALRGTGKWCGTISTPGSVFTDSLARDRCITSIQPIALRGEAIFRVIPPRHTLGLREALEQCGRPELEHRSRRATALRVQAEVIKAMQKNAGMFNKARCLPLKSNRNAYRLLSVKSST